MIRRPFIAVATAAALLLAVACRPDVERSPAEESAKPAAPRIERVGDARLPITTRAPLAQQFFDQGLRLAYAFDHAEALRAFSEAARIDPECAMCAWGMAYAIGPNINDPGRPADPRAARHAQRALDLAIGATRKERALIGALAARLDLAAPPAAVADASPSSPVCAMPPPPQDADPLDIAYAQAMASVAREFPDDDEVTVLYAEALLMLSPWQWWSRDGAEPRECTLAAIDTLERVLARSPGHAGANHFLIHALEASRTPARALAAAERLAQLAPDAGHMVHMASHIFVRVGRYADAVRSNQQAIDADRRLDAQLRAQGFEPLGHVSHHHHFLWAAAAMQGNAAVALDAARWLAAEAARPEQPYGDGGSNDYFLALPWLAQVRFARWEEILAAPEPKWPAHASSYPRAVRHYARGMALARIGNVQGASQELRALQSAAQDPALQGLTLKGIDDLGALLALAESSLRGEILLARRQHRRAIEALRRAVEQEDALESEEPPPWAVPARQALGAALLIADSPGGAERVYRADLDRHPDNGWSLYGLAESLRRQRRGEEAALFEARFRTAWRDADLAQPDARY
jgi:tetratricopeptide (TPR) repeat protein